MRRLGFTTVDSSISLSHRERAGLTVKTDLGRQRTGARADEVVAARFIEPVNSDRLAIDLSDGAVCHGAFDDAPVTSRLIRLLTLAGLLAVSLIALSWAGCGGGERSASGELAHARAVTSYSDPGLTFSAKMIDLGYVPPGGRSQQIITLRNGGTMPLKLSRLRTSCECLRAHYEARKIKPDETVAVLVIVDLSGDSRFVGNLMGTIEALDQRGEPIASVGVALIVDPIARVLENRF